MKQAFFFLILCIFISNIIAAEKTKSEAVMEQIKINNIEYENQCKQIVLAHKKNMQRLEQASTKKFEILRMYMIIADTMLDSLDRIKTVKACQREKEKETTYFLKEMEESNTYAMKSISVACRMNDKKNFLLIQQLTQ